MRRIAGGIARMDFARYDHMVSHSLCLAMILKAANDNTPQALGRIIARRMVSVSVAVIGAIVYWMHWPTGTASVSHAGAEAWVRRTHACLRAL